MTEARTEAVRRQGEAAAPGGSAWVSANAGTGKTTVLTNRLLRLLLDGAGPERLLAITFTRAAAAEMENRLFARLARWAAMNDRALAADIGKLAGGRPDPETLLHARKLLVRVLECPGGMRIQTIHAFCQSLLGSFPIEAGLPPHFRVLDESEALAFRREARTETLRQAAGKDEALEAALAEVVRAGGEDELHKVLDQLTRDRFRLLAAVKAAGGVDTYAVKIANVLEVKPGEDEDDVIRAAHGRSLARAGQLEAAAAALPAGTNKTASMQVAGIRSWLARGGSDEGLAEAWENWRLVFLTKAGTIRSRLVPAAVQRGNPEVTALLADEAEKVEQEEHRRRRVRIARVSAAFVRLGVDEVERYERFKRNRAAVDYDDLIERTGRLLTRREASEWILYKLDNGIDHVLVDEAQDTSPGQWRVIEAVAGEFFAGRGTREDGPPRTLFAVGDPKQSIFRFQGADPEAFGRMRESFGTRATDGRIPWQVVDLNLSFRSTPAVLGAVDAVANSCGPGVASEDERVEHLADRVAVPGSVEAWPPVEPDEGATGQNAAVEKLAGMMAERIAAMTEGTAPEGGPPVPPGDIMVLVRKRIPFMPYIARALKLRGVPVAGLDRMQLVEQAAVVDLMNLGRFLLLPDDDLALANVLKGPLCGLDRGISEEGLFALAHGRKGRLWGALRERHAERPEYGAARERLTHLLRLAERLAPFDLFSEALDGEGGSRNALLARLGSDAGEAVEEFLVQAVEYGNREVPSLEGFLAWLTREEIEVKRDMEAAGGSVRILTVHGAKGLEAPVVFVAERAGKPILQDKVTWTGDGTVLRRFPGDQREAITEGIAMRQEEEDLREYRRLLYVAMTRARDRLVIASWRKREGKSDEHWPAMAWNALPDAGATEADPPVPGLPGPVLALANDGPERAGEEAPAPPAPGAPAPAWARIPPAPEPPVRRPRSPSGPPGRVVDPAAVMRGEFAHLLLDRLPDEPPFDREGTALELGRRHAADLPEAVRSEVAGKVIGLLADPALADLFGAGSRAEVRIAGQVGDDIVRGRVDRLVVDGERALAVEFKSGAAPKSWASAHPAHRNQILDYVALLRDMHPDREVRGALLYLEGPVLIEAEARPT